MLKTATPLKTTPLFFEHQRLGAKLAPFGGWNMPIQYEGIIAEALHTRSAVSCFDICHMGEFLISGDAQACGLDRLVSAKITSMPQGSCRYSSLLDLKGGVIDDLLIYRLGQREWMIVVNAATIEKDKTHFLQYLDSTAHLLDISGQTAKIDLQGPASRDVIKKISPQSADLPYYTFAPEPSLGTSGLISRTGYTGELGFEIYCSNETVAGIWETLLKNKTVKPAGLGARDILRLEMGYSLYGQDIDETITPLEAGLEKFIDYSKDFLGKDALLRQKKDRLKKNRVFFETLNRRSPRHGHKIFINNSSAGEVTSGTFSPHLNRGIGMGLTQAPLVIGEKILIGDDQTKIEAVVCDKPFVKNTSLKN